MHQNAEREDVRSTIDLAGIAKLLGSGVGRRAHPHLAVGLDAAVWLVELRDPEIEDHHAQRIVLGLRDVQGVGLDVPVDQVG